MIHLGLFSACTLHGEQRPSLYTFGCTVNSTAILVTESVLFDTRQFPFEYFRFFKFPSIFNQFRSISVLIQFAFAKSFVTLNSLIVRWRKCRPIHQGESVILARQMQQQNVFFASRWRYQSACHIRAAPLWSSLLRELIQWILLLPLIGGIAIRRVCFWLVGSLVCLFKFKAKMWFSALKQLVSQKRWVIRQKSL